MIILDTLIIVFFVAAIIFLAPILFTIFCVMWDDWVERHRNHKS